MSFEAVACIDCFSNFGFKQTLKLYCKTHHGICLQCGATEELKVDRDGLIEAMSDFYVGGSYVIESWAPVYQVNESCPYLAKFDPTVALDAELACKITGLVIFDYGPPLWRLGITEHYYSFEMGGEWRRKAAEEIIQASKCTIIERGTRLFRVRRNPRVDETIVTAAAFDPPPQEIKRDFGRWDDFGHPVLYASDDVELCLHECRVTISDEIVVGTLSLVRDLRLLDLSKEIASSGSTPYEDPNVFIDMMCCSRGQWLEWCREISRVAYAKGYDGIRYPSYYAQAKKNAKSLNLAIFGSPLQEGLLKLESVNRLRINNASYQYQFGPVLYCDTDMKVELEQMIKK